MISKIKKKICVVGLGYVGLPLLLIFLKKKYEVYGFEIDKKKIDLLKKKKSYINDISDKELKKLKKTNLYHKNFSKIKDCDYIIYTLPTPINKYKPDLKDYKKSIIDTFKYLKKEQTLIFESTVYPGATEELFLDQLRKKFEVGKNLYLAYSPERIDPGNAKNKKFKINNTTKLVSGYSKKCLSKITKIYSTVFKNIYKCNSIKEAECAKVYENTFRYINISFVNEFKIMSQKLKIDYNDVIKASSTKQFGFIPFQPGPGIGGHCIPVDPFYLDWISKKNNFYPHMINASKIVNTKLNFWLLNQIKKNIVNDKKILVVGLSYKKNINDLRNSPGLSIFKEMLKLYKKKEIRYHDPYVPIVNIGKKKLKSVENIEKIKFDTAIIFTDHDIINFELIFKNCKKILDTRNVSIREELKKKVIYI